MQEDPFETTLDPPEPERERAQPLEVERALDARHRRGSLGPPPVAAPLGETAPGAVLQAHLAQLLHAGREAAPPAFIAGTAAEPLTPHEDVERQPDGVPHLVVGLTALASVALAAVLIGLSRSDPALGVVAAVAIAVVAIPMLVFKLGAKAERDRDHDHPSR